LRKISSKPAVVETISKMNSHQPRVSRESYAQMESSGKPKKVVDLWIQLFSDILDDEQLTEKFHNTMKVALGAEGNPKEFVVINLPERKTSRFQRRNRRNDREFKSNSEIDDFEMKEVMLELGFVVNIFPKKTWEAMGNPKLFYSPI
jgi:hypothetical protein